MKLAKSIVLTSTERMVVINFAKDQCERWGGGRRVFLELGLRYNLDTEVENLNWLIVDPDGENSDLADHTDWSVTRGELELTEDGRGEFDVYVSNYEGLVCNIQFEVDTKGLKALHADVDRNLWTRK